MYCAEIKFNELGFNFHRSLLCLLIILLVSAGCKNDKTAGDQSETLFKLLPAAQTHIEFSNALTEGLNTNVLIYHYFYNGGGVATGDLNGDGYQDIYFTGNMTDNKLYLNQQRMQFKDVTATAGVAGRPGPWKTGVSLVDINGDSKLDIYVCHSGKLSDAKRINQLFVNQGNDQNGIPLFKDMATQYGLGFPSYSTQAYFFDSDRDGDLDLLLVNHNIDRLNLLDDASVKDFMNQSDSQAGLRLLENNNGVYKDITASSGIANTTLSYGLAAGIADVNGDGAPDIYVSNDYSMPDRLYINNGTGNYSDQLTRQMGHTSFYSMGNDIADINNDAEPDIYTLDMLPEDNNRQKLLFGADNYEAFNLNVRVGFYYQYMRNMLHVNNGNNTFSEVGQLAGISNTDWSWAPLFADYDNDGWKDLFVSNGYTRDYTNMDFLKFMGDNLRDRHVVREDLLNIVGQMPSSQVKSYFFKNRGDGSFENAGASWGITQASNGNGAAYVDLDNDGDLDLIENNVNQPAFIYENLATSKNQNRWLSVSLKGNAPNTQGIGAKVILYTAGEKQYLQQMPTRGFQSSVSPMLHFGLGKHRQVDSLRIVWPLGKTQLVKNVKSNTQIILTEKDASFNYFRPKSRTPLFQIKTALFSDRRTANNINDFKRQPLMVNPLSFTGSLLVKGDVDGDKLEDIYVGAHNGHAAELYLQQANGQFRLKTNESFAINIGSTDAAAAFFDADQDGTLDLYVCSGGYDNYLPNDARLQDRLYLNDGTGKFKLSRNALPAMISSKSCVKVADINADGFPDVFVGGRVIPGRYPETPQSYILLNNGRGQFADVTKRYSADIGKIGMVSDAAWSDMNSDGRPDLILVGEWMPVMVFENTGAKLVDATKSYFDKQYSGWWNCLSVSDINRDGRPDIIAGNLGTNTQCRASDNEPAEMFYKDFDDNGSVDPILCLYIQHKTYPFMSRDEMLDQMSTMRTRFPDYRSFADATLDKVFDPEELHGAGHLSANYLYTACFTSRSDGKLRPVSLPIQAQYAPVYTTTVLDFDDDGMEDLLLCGNVNAARLRFGKYDANYGVLLKGDGKGNFKYVSQQQSGFNLVGDVRSVLKLGKRLLFSLDRGRTEVYERMMR